ncbi:hypothetical protein SAMN06298216_4127 [Spirosomataceae bacterium TFI 002]|nr:hypothetical protein SAMN06298216_4127 [Spirosomataceae bacterium TFI 002]
MFKTKKCKVCGSDFTGRSNKVFCNVKCKNYYHKNLRYNSVKAAIRINEYLKRNHGILQEIIGKNLTQIKVYRNVLEDKRFRFKYHTHSYVNSKGKRMNYVYNLAWMEFSDDEILIIRK